MFSTFKTVLAGAVCVAAMALPPLPASADALAEIKERGTLRVAGLVYRPFIFRTPGGEYGGAERDILTGLSEALGVELEFVDAEWSTAVAGLGTGKWDIVPALCNTEARREAIDFSDDYLTVGPVLAVMSGQDKIASVEDANDGSVLIAVNAGGFSEKVALEAFPNAELKTFAAGGQDQAILEVLTGRADATVVDTPVAVSVLQAAHGDRLTFLPGPDQAMDVRVCSAAYGIAKGESALQEAVNDYLATIAGDGTLDGIKDKYLTAEFVNQ